MAKFRFKQFVVDDYGCGMKVGTDSVLLGAWTDFADCKTIVDLGCGSGLLSLMAAQKAPDATITGVEIDAGACDASARNFAASPWADRLSIVNADATTYKPSTLPDLIISNPPYFSDGLLSPEAKRATARHGNTGLSLSGLSPLNVITLASQMLDDDGTLAMVTPAEDFEKIVFEAEMHRLPVWRQCMVHTTDRKPATRILWQFCRRPRPLEKISLTIRSDGKFTQEYISLTEDFYLYLH